jgi:hypothetical protein
VFSFGGAIFMLARQGEGSIEDLHWNFIWWIYFSDGVVVTCSKGFWGFLEEYISSSGEAVELFQVLVYLLCHYRCIVTAIAANGRFVLL